MFGFNPDRLYRPADPEMRNITSVAQLSQWRFYGRGPDFIKYGNKVYYAGADLIAWLEKHRVQPAA